MTRVIVKLAADARNTANAPMGISHYAVGVVEELANSYTQLLNTGAEPNEIVAKIADLPGINSDSCKLMIIGGLVHTIE